MIGKVFLTGKTFGETCQYLCQEQSRAMILDANGVRTHDHKLMAEDFEWQHRLMPGKEKPVFHAVLSFPPGERVDDARLAEIGREYLRRVDVVNTQYAFVKHTDKEHLHVHILANRVNNDGEPTGKGLVVERSIKAAKQLTEEYGLKQELGKRLERTNVEALHEPDVKRYRIYSAIQESLPKCRSLSDLEERLQQQGITMRYRNDPETNVVQGISFRLENRSFKGSRVDAEFSLRGLERKLELQQRQTLQQTRALQPEQTPQEKLRQSLAASLERLVSGRLSGWDEGKSLRRRQDLKERLAKAEQERLSPLKEEVLRVEQAKRQAQEQEQQQVPRMRLRL